MKAIEFPQQNSKHIADGCYDLPTCKIKNKQFGADEIISCWELEEENIVFILKQIKDGIRPSIYLSVIGGQPPVRLSCNSPV